MISSVIGILALVAFPALQESEPRLSRSLVQTADQTAMGRCLNGLAGVSGVRMQCVLDAEGRPDDCRITNPSPAVMRREYVFQCMASKMRFTYSDGSSAEGETVMLNLGGRTVLGEEDMLREREAQRRAEP